MKVNSINASELVNKIQKIEQVKLECKVSLQDFDKISNNNAVIQMSQKEYKTLMQVRPLIKYRPLKNSMTKKVDKSLLAQGLNIPESDIETYITGIVQNDFKEGSAIKLNENCYKELKQNEVDMVRNYVYRHGNKDEVIAYLDNELYTAKDVLKTLYETLDFELNGVSSYYNRPCHPLSDSDAKDMQDVIQKNLDIAENSGQISHKQNLQSADDALERIRLIQNNPDIRQAFKFVWNNKSTMSVD